MFTACFRTSRPAMKVERWCSCGKDDVVPCRGTDQVIGRCVHGPFLPVVLVVAE